MTRWGDPRRWLGCGWMLALAWVPRASAAPLQSAQWALEVRGATVIALTNRLTHEGFGSAAPKLEGALHLLTERQLEPGMASSAVLRPAEGALEFTASWPGSDGAERARMTTRFVLEGPSGDLLITQSGEAKERGLYGVSWCLGEIPDDFEVLVPGGSGQRFGTDAPQGRSEFEYPMLWEVPFVLIQGREGGFIIRAEDAEYRFKKLVVERVRRFCRLRFESRTFAPFEDKTRLESSRWRLSAYRGPWQGGADVYRRWAQKQFALTPLEQQQPAWARDIRFVVIMNLNRVLLKALAARCRPAQTLLYLPNWRRDEYDRNYPDYTASAAFGPFVAEAHRFGFRVMPHVNYFGCDPKHPLYAQLKQWQVRDPFTKELQWWDWPAAEPPIKFAYINPASRAWRQLFVARMVELCRQCPVDALHLDQTLCAYNDAAGPIDGLNFIEGNVALHRELRRALPEVALSGEGLNEVTCREEAFAQRHVWGMDHAHGTWDDRYIAMAHPVSSFLLTRHTQLYGYLGLPNPAHTPYATAWQRAYEHFGVLPTYAWPDAAQLENPSLAAAQLLDRARYFQETKPVPDFDAPWQTNDLFVYRLASGERAFIRRDQGVVFAVPRRRDPLPPAAPDPPALTILSRRIEDLSAVTVAGSLPGWPAYDATRIFGLDPRRQYAWSPQPRDLGAPHLSHLPAPFLVARSGIHQDFARFRFDAFDSNATHIIRLWDFRGDATGGVRLASGTSRRHEGAEFDDESGGAVHPEGAGLFIHPPWKGAGVSGPTAVTFVEFSLRLPAAETVAFSSGVHLRDGAEGKSDGVRFRVLAMGGGRTLRAEAFNAARAAKPLDLDLTTLGGQDMVLRLEADPGAAGRPDFDWGRFAEPRIEPRAAPKPEIVPIRLTGGRRILHALTDRGKAESAPVASREIEARAPWPGALILLFDEPNPVALPFDLLKAPFSSHVLYSDGLELPSFSFFGGSVVEAACGGRTRRALSLHPPQAGRSLADFRLRLPDQPLRLVTAVGLRDGSKSNGAVFLVEVNGREVFEKSLEAGAGWQPVEVVLTPWRGQPVLLTLVTDAGGDFNFDWCVWAEPTLVLQGPP